MRSMSGVEGHSSTQMMPHQLFGISCSVTLSLCRIYLSHAVLYALSGAKRLINPQNNPPLGSRPRAPPRCFGPLSAGGGESLGTPTIRSRCSAGLGRRAAPLPPADATSEPAAA